jgi:hypothetical protein
VSLEALEKNKEEMEGMVVDIMVPTVCVIRSHKKKIESSPSMIFPQGMVTTKVLPSALTISNLQQ